MRQHSLEGSPHLMSLLQLSAVTVAAHQRDNRDSAGCFQTRIWLRLFFGGAQTT